jgi:hypothetical protein
LQHHDTVSTPSLQGAAGQPYWAEPQVPPSLGDVHSSAHWKWPLWAVGSFVHVAAWSSRSRS